MTTLIETWNATLDIADDAYSEQLRTCTPVIVQSWTEPASVGARCDVQLTIPNRAPDGSAIEPTPVVAERPVYYPGGGGWVVHYPMAAGDETLGLCMDRNTDGWETNRSPGAPSNALFERYHDENNMVVMAVVDRPVLPSPAADLDTDFIIAHKDGGVVIRAGVDGKVTITASETCSVVVEPGGKVTINSTEIVLGGMADVAAKGQALIDAIDAAWAGATPIANDGGVGLKTSWLSTWSTVKNTIKSTVVKIGG